MAVQWTIEDNLKRMKSHESGVKCVKHKIKLLEKNAKRPKVHGKLQEFLLQTFTYPTPRIQQINEVTDACEDEKLKEKINDLKRKLRNASDRERYCRNQILKLEQAGRNTSVNNTDDSTCYDSESEDDELYRLRKTLCLQILRLLTYLQALIHQNLGR